MTQNFYFHEKFWKIQRSDEITNKITFDDPVVRDQDATMLDPIITHFLLSFYNKLDLTASLCFLSRSTNSKETELVAVWFADKKNPQPPLNETRLWNMPGCTTWKPRSIDYLFPRVCSHAKRGVTQEVLRALFSPDCARNVQRLTGLRFACQLAAFWLTLSKSI